MWLTPYAGANRIRFNGTLSADALSGVGTPVTAKGNLLNGFGERSGSARNGARGISLA